MGGIFGTQKRMIERVGDFELVMELRKTDHSDFEKWCYVVRNVKTEEMSISFNATNAREHFRQCVAGGKFVGSMQ